MDRALTFSAFYLRERERACTPSCGAGARGRGGERIASRLRLSTDPEEESDVQLRHMTLRS